MLDHWTGDLRKTRDEIDRLLVALETGVRRDTGTDEE